MRLALKLIIGIIILVGISMGFLTILSVSSVRDALEEKIGKSQLQLAEQTLGEIDRTLYGGVQDIRVISEAEDFEDLLVKGNIGESINTLYDFTFLTGPWDELELFDKEGFIVVSTDKKHIGKSIQQEDVEEKLAYQIALQGDIYYSDLIMSEDTGKLTVLFAAPIKNEEAPRKPIVGVVIGNFAWQVIIEILQEAESDDITLLNKNGVVIGKGRQHQRAIKNAFLTQKNVLAMVDFEKEGEHTKIYDRGIDIQEKVLSSVVSQKGHLTYEGSEWVLVLDTKIDTAFVDVNSLVRKLLLGTFIILLIIIALSFFFSRSISNPIIKLSQTAREIGKGNLDVKADVHTKDEIGDLAKTINKMTVDLKQYQTRLLEAEKIRSEDLDKEVKKKTTELTEKVKDTESSRIATLNMMEDLQESHEHLKDLEKAKTNFLNMISHELKTPLTAIFAHLDILEDIKSDLNKYDRSSFEAIKRNNLQLKTLIDNILEISRIESKKFELNLVKINLENIIKEVLKELKIFSDKKGLKLITKIDKLPIMRTDGIRLKGILINLIGNAIKFTEKGSVTVEAKKQDDKFVLIKVIDTGVGIPKDKIKNLFQKFYQVDASLGRKYGGTGLGLSITKQLIEALGGKINVKSVYGEGSTFYFSLPITMEGEQKAN